MHANKASLVSATLGRKRVKQKLGCGAAQTKGAEDKYERRRGRSREWEDVRDEETKKREEKVAVW